MQKRIVQLTTHDFRTPPFTGGPLRVRETARVLRGLGAAVHTVQASFEMRRKKHSPHYFWCGDHREYCKRFPLSSISGYYELLIGEWVTHEASVYKAFAAKIRSLHPNIILLEHGFLWRPVKKMIEDGLLSKDVQIVYSSHNVEYKVCRDLMTYHSASQNISPQMIKECSGEIFAIEEELCRRANAVLCCTESDAAEFARMGSNNIIVCGNGTAEPKKSRVRINIPKHVRYAFFVSANYAPNAVGFWKMFENSLAFLPPDYYIFVAGGIYRTPHILPDKNQPEYAVNRDRMRLLGTVSDAALQALLARAGVIILPITSGGGSNLKTAESIAYGKPVVATTTACRGFEWAKDLSNFTVTDDPKIFADSVLRFLSAPSTPKPPPEERERRQSVLWKHRLAPLRRLLE